MPFSMYIEPLKSPNACWLTLLHLRNVSCARADIINLSQFPNIVALTIGANVRVPEDRIDDTIMRSWSRHATEQGGFPKLKVLTLRAQQDLTRRSVQYAHDIPNLSYLVLEDTRLYADYHDYGWENAKPYIQIDDWGNMMASLCKCSSLAYDGDGEGLDTGTIAIVELSLGGKQPRELSGKETWRETTRRRSPQDRASP
jgi:hypothetical protein